MKKIICSLNWIEWLLYSGCVVMILILFFVFKNTEYLYLIGALIGATALIFVSKGNPLGQLLTIVFSVFYGIISYSYRYYGEMITYLGMTSPIAVWALISWIRNPYKENKAEVTVNTLSKKEWVLSLLITSVITVIFFFILRALKTENLWISTLSVFTSFAASYLTARRSRFYAIMYGINDLVLIILWTLASIDNLTYIPMVACFVSFLILDSYGFIQWSLMNKRQKKESISSSNK